MNTEPQTKEQRLIRKLRSHFGLPEGSCTDHELIEATKGSLGYILIETAMALEDLSKEIERNLPRLFAKLIFKHKDNND